MPSRMEIRWQGPYSFKELMDLYCYKKDSEEAQKLDCPGVYLRVEKWHDGSMVLGYVGESLSILKRQKEHYIHMISGQYMIPGEFRTTNADWSSNAEVPETNRVLTDRDAYLVLVKDAFAYAKSCWTYFFPVAKEVRKDLELNLLRQLQPRMTRRGTKSEPANKIELGHLVPDDMLYEVLSSIESPGTVNLRRLG